jgi:hypothetical protein
MIFLLEINGAASGNRTRIMSLEGSDSAIELPPLGDRQEAGLQGRSALPDKWTRRQESNLPGGFCRPVPGRSATPRYMIVCYGSTLLFGAGSKAKMDSGGLVFDLGKI